MATASSLATSVRASGRLVRATHTLALPFLQWLAPVLLFDA